MQWIVLDGVLASLSCYNKVHKVCVFKGQKVIVSQSEKLKVWGQGGSRAMLPSLLFPAFSGWSLSLPSLGLQMHHSDLCCSCHIHFSPFMFVFVFTCHTSSHWAHTTPLALILTCHICKEYFQTRSHFKVLDGQYLEEGKYQTQYSGQQNNTWDLRMGLVPTEEKIMKP